MTSAADVVTLAGGLTLASEALAFAIDLDLKGVALTAHGDELIASPRALLTDSDLANLRRYKRHMLALVVYEPPAYHVARHHGPSLSTSTSPVVTADRNARQHGLPMPEPAPLRALPSFTNPSTWRQPR